MRSHIGTSLVTIGIAIEACAGVASIIAASMFTLPYSPPPLVDAIGRACFWGFIPLGLFGALFLVMGLLLKRS